MEITLPGLRLFKQAHLYAPDCLGVQDFLVAGEKLSLSPRRLTPAGCQAARSLICNRRLSAPVLLTSTCI